MGILITDNFQRVAGNLGPNWTQRSGGFSTNNGAVATSNAVFNVATYSAEGFALNQQLTITIGSNSNGNNLGVNFRWTDLGGGSWSYYTILISPSGISLYKVIGGSSGSDGTATQLGSAFTQTISPGDIITVSCFGPFIRVFYNGASNGAAISIKDTTLTNGSQCGLFENGGLGDVVTSWSSIDFRAPSGTKLNVICDGDSKTWGQLTPTPWPSSLSLALTPNNVDNFGIDGGLLSDAITNAPNYIDPLIFSGASNVCVVWYGTNDLANSVSPASLFSMLTTYCNARRAAGWKVVTAPLMSAPGIDTQVQQFNALLAANPSVADAIVSLPSTLTALNAYQNSTYFNVASGHPTQNTATFILAPAFSQAINGLLGLTTTFEKEGFRFKLITNTDGTQSLGVHSLLGGPGNMDEGLEIQGYRIQLHDNGDGTFSPVSTTTTGAGDVSVEHEGFRMKLHPTGSNDPVTGEPMYAIVTVTV